MHGRGFKAIGARWWCAAASALLSGSLLAQPAPAAQTAPPPDPTELDPNAPLDPMPDLGVAWPELNAKDTAPPPSASPSAKVRSAPVAGEMRYTVEVQGLASVSNAEELLRAKPAVR